MKFNAKKISLLVAVLALGVFTLMSFANNNDNKAKQTTVATTTMDAQAAKCGDGKCGDGKCADMKAKKDAKSCKGKNAESCAGTARSCAGKCADMKAKKAEKATK